MLTVEMQIKLAGMAMEEEEMAQWWDAERDDLLKLVTWGGIREEGFGEMGADRVED